MKKYIAILLTATMLAAVLGCRGDDASDGTETATDTVISSGGIDTEGSAPTDETVYSEGALRVVRTDGKLYLYNGDTLAAERVYDSFFTLYADGRQVLYLLRTLGDRVELSWFDENGDPAGDHIAKRADKFGNYIVTDERIYDASMNLLVYFPMYAEDFFASNIICGDDYIIVDGVDTNGRAVSFEYIAGEVDADALPAPVITVDGDETRAVSVSSVYTSDGKIIGMLTIDAPVTAKDAVT